MVGHGLGEERSRSVRGGRGEIKRHGGLLTVTCDERCISSMGEEVGRAEDIDQARRTRHVLIGPKTLGDTIYSYRGPELSIPSVAAFRPDQIKRLGRRDSIRRPEPHETLDNWQERF